MTFEDATSIMDEKNCSMTPVVYFDPAKKTLRRIIQNLNLQKGSVDNKVESDIAMYIADKFTSVRADNVVSTEYDALRTMSIQLTSFWGSKLPTVSTYSESTFMDSYEEFEEITQKAARRLGW
ncbi:MAG: hypothetical protein HQ517_14060 [SAR324 cluster bacterium]|nr:hypothetical protein [SAR324 cluster bacterium]